MSARRRPPLVACAVAIAALALPRGAAALEDRAWMIDLEDSTNPVLSIQNRGASTVEIEPVALNGRAVLHSLADVQAEIDTLPPQPPDDSPAVRIFRFVTDNRQHSFPLTLNFQWLLTPSLFFDSSGINLCDEAAELVYSLATARGLPARTVGLGGHVVAEVYEAGRWKMFDADYGVFFLDHEGAVASMAELEVDPTLITNPLLTLPWTGPYSPYTIDYAELFAPPNGPATDPVVTLPSRPVRFSLPRGASLRLPGRFAVAPPDTTGAPLYDYRDLALRLPAGVTGPIDNPLIVHALRGAGRVEIDGTSFEIGSSELGALIDARNDALPTLRIEESRGPIEILYLLNPLRWQLAASSRLTARVTESAVLDVRGVPTGASGADSDGDGVGDDGGGNGIVGDQPCAGNAVGCDDNCPFDPNPAQLDADGDGRGNACDADLDGDELVTSADLRILQPCETGTASPDDPACLESDLDENGRVNGDDEARFSVLAARAGALAAPADGCGIGPELTVILIGLRSARARTRVRGSP